MSEYTISSPPGTLRTQPPPPPIFDLRPLSLGEILDRTFALYRRKFWLYCGLASVAAAVATLGTFVRLTWGIASVRVQTAQGPRELLITSAVSLVAALLYFFAFSITQAATVAAVQAAYLGGETSIAIALRSVMPHWFRYILVAAWQAWSAIWLTLLLVTPAFALLAMQRLNLAWLGGLLVFLALLSLAYGLIAYMRNSLGIVASVSQDLTVRDAMRRSKQLVAGRKGRVLALLLLLYVLNLVAGVLQGTFAVFLMLSHTAAAHVALEAMTLLMTFITTSMVAPVGAIAFCLFYIDARVRSEGYDLEVLMQRAGEAPAGSPAFFAQPAPGGVGGQT